jgi:thymidylate synthase
LRSFDTFNDAYPSIFIQCQSSGADYSPKGDPCREIRPYSFQLKDPKKALYTGDARRLNYRFLAVECLSYIAGWYGTQHAELMIAANSQYEKYKNADGTLIDMVTYGKSLQTELPKVVEILKKDIDSRQAVALIYGEGTPCTISMQFFTERSILPSMSKDVKLSMSVNMRSNDINWGLPYDVASFCAIQLAVADCLNMEVGTYTHNTGSMHYYEATKPKLWNEAGDRCMDGKAQRELSHGVPSGKTYSDSTFESEQRMAMQFLDKLYHHVIKKGEPFSSFTFNGLPHSTKWYFWQKMVNFSWK